jgi:hypothetical protein
MDDEIHRRPSRLPQCSDACDKSSMADSYKAPKRRGAVPLSALVRQVLDPVTARRGFATADIISAWPEIVGSRFADCTAPEKIVWPRGEENAGAPGMLVLRVDGPRAVLVQHETAQIAQRVNAFLGYGAIAQVRIVQAPVEKRERPGITRPPELTESQEAALGATVASVGGDRIRAALTRLGRVVIGESRAGRRRELP